jgi:hypothetical protein
VLHPLVTGRESAPCRPRNPPRARKVGFPSRGTVNGLGLTAAAFEAHKASVAEVGHRLHHSVPTTVSHGAPNGLTKAHPANHRESTRRRCQFQYGRSTRGPLFQIREWGVKRQVDPERCTSRGASIGTKLPCHGDCEIVASRLS